MQNKSFHAAQACICVLTSLDAYWKSDYFKIVDSYGRDRKQEEKVNKIKPIALSLKRAELTRLKEKLQIRTSCISF